MHVPIQHIIGTVAIIGLMISVGLAYNIETSFVQQDISQQQLAQVSEMVALNIADTVNLANFANFGNFTRNNTVMISLNLPLDLAGRAYAVQLMNETGDNQRYNVNSYLLDQHTTNASATVPFNSAQDSVQLTTDVTDAGNLYWIETGVEAVTSSIVVYGGNSRAVVWAWKGEGNATLAGLGVISVGQAGK